MTKMENAEQAVFTARVVKREAAEPPTLRYPVIFYGDSAEVKKAERQQTLQMYVLLMHRFLRKCCSEIRRLP